MSPRSRALGRDSRSRIDDPVMGFAFHVRSSERELFLVSDILSELDAREIPRHLLGNNQLGPRPGVPRGGDAQVWRARLQTLDGHLELPCWALRRFGSRVGEQLEFIAAERLRALALQEDQRVEAILFGRWHDT
jgi:hypothetical protein